MQIPRSRIGPAAVIGALLLIPLSLSPLTAPAAADDSGEVTVTATEQSRWSGGFQTEVTITNGTGAPLKDWAIEFGLPDGAKVHEMWNASLERDGGGYSATPPRWGAAVPAGKSYTFGYTGTLAKGGPASTPVYCTVNGAPCAGSGSGEEYRQVGYFTQWGVADRGYTVKDLADTGNAGRLTHLNYAFANTGENGECFVSDEDGKGDAASDYGRAYSASESVDGRADKADQPLRGTFNQLRKLKRANPGMKVSIAIGGWEWSDYLSNAALPENRERSVKSCIDLYLRGNLPEMNGAGGPGSAAGVFDGIDLDWEWPGTEGEPGNVIRPEDKENYTAWVQEFRRQLDALEEEKGRDYGLTAFVPASEAAIDAGYEVDALVEEFDFLNVQGYDLAGAWNPATGHQSNLVKPDHPDAPERSLETVVQAYLDRGAEPEDLVLGMPFYGRGWTGVEPGANGDGLYGAAKGAAPGVHEPGFNDYKVLKERVGKDGFTVHRDDRAGTAWLYNGTEFWNFDDPKAIGLKAAWAREKGLAGAMSWSLDGDDADGSLYGAIDRELNGR